MAIDFRNVGRKSEEVIIADSNSSGRYNSASTGLSAGSKVLRNAYTLLAISMIPAMVGAWAGFNFFPIKLMASSPIMTFFIFLGVFYGLIFAVEKNNTSSTGIVLLQLFTFVLGFMAGPALMVASSMSNGWQLVAIAFGGTATIFFTMAAVATMIKKPLTGLTNFLVVGGVILMIGVIASVFLQIPALQMAITCGFLLFSTILMLWRINMAYHMGNYNYISLTLGLVIDIYNIFMSLLRLLMAFAGNRN